jgi:hypothetical protein
MFYSMSLFQVLPPDRPPTGEPKVAPRAKVFAVGPTTKTYRLRHAMDSRF